MNKIFNYFKNLKFLKLNNKYCLQCDMPRLSWGEDCLFCHPQLIKQIYKKKNYNLLKILAIYYLISYLLICIMGFYFFQPILTRIIFHYNYVFTFAFIGIVYFLTLLTVFLLPIIVRFIIFKKPINHINAYLLAIINILLIGGISYLIFKKLEISNCFITYFISVFILDYGYDKRLLEIDIDN